MYLAIVSATPEGRVAKFAEFETQPEAEAHVAEYGGFVAEKPDAPWSHWLISGQSVTVDPPEVPEPVVHYSKAQLFAAMTDAEYGQWVAAQAAFPARQQAIFDHAAVVESDHALFPSLRAAMVSAYGENRTAELLASAEI